MTATPRPPGSPNPLFSIVQTVLSGVLLAAVLGFWQFYAHTNAELAALRSEVGQMREKVGEIYRIVDTAFPRQSSQPGDRSPQPGDPR